jgi:predicted HicB family RNase H-like nuclease
MACKDEITVSAKVKIEVHDALKRMAIDEGVGMNTLVKQMVLSELYNRGYKIGEDTSTV